MSLLNVAKKSGRGRGRRNLNPSPSLEGNIDRIFVWYIDETILIFLTMAEYQGFSNYNVSVLGAQHLEMEESRLRSGVLQLESLATSMIDSNGHEPQFHD